MEVEQRKRDKHLQAVDSTKKLFIDQILRRTCFDDTNDAFEEVIQAHIRGKSSTASQDTIEKQKAKEIQKIRNS